MPQYKLKYFDFDGGRGEPARLIMVMTGLAFEDDRFALTEWPARKPQMPFQTVPVLEVDGRALAQTNAILRYLGRLSGLYPDDAWQGALCDEVMDAVEHLTVLLGPTMAMPAGDERKAAREALAAGPFSVYLKRLDAMLTERGEYFAAGRLTVADLKVYVWVRHLRSGVLDDFPKDLVDRCAPRLVEHQRRVGDEPRIRAYYDARRK